MKKILVSDYDGTFFISEEGIKLNVQKVKEFRKLGNLFAIATGNNLESFMNVVRRYNIEYDYLILDQGSVAVNSSNEIILNCTIDAPVATNVYKEVQKHSDNISLFNPWRQCENIEGNNITKISTRITDIDIAKKLTEELNCIFQGDIHAYTMIFDDINIVEIISAKTDKKEAIKQIARDEKVSRDNIFVVGDGYNDITMIDFFNGYCMKNAVPELLNRCNNHVSSVSDLINILKDKNTENETELSL